MRSFEVDVGANEEMENPLRVQPDAASSGHDRTRHIVMAEFEERDGNLAQAIETEDLFEVIKESMHDERGRTWNEAAESELKEMFKQVHDWSAPIQKKELKRMLEASLHVVISNKLLVDLFRQIDTDGSDSVTAHEFYAWFQTQMRTTEEEGEVMDPHQAQMKQMQAQTYIIDPNSDLRGNWDMVQAGLLMYIAVIVPYRIGFNDNVELWSGFFFFDLSIDIYFVTDLCLNFRTAVITAEGEILYTPKEIANNYLHGWFPIDFVSCLPFSYAEYFLQPSGEPTDGSNNRAVRLLRLVRLLKLLRLVRIKRILDRWEEEMYGASMLKLGKLLFVIFAASHWVACLWYAVGSPSEFADEIETNTRGEPIHGWVTKKYSSYPTDELTGENTTMTHSFLDRYMDSLWWASLAVLMIAPETDAREGGWAGLPELHMEKIVYGSAMMAGAFIMSVLIGSMSDIISHSNPGEKRKTDAVSVVKGFLHERKISPILTRRVRAHFSLLYTMRGTTADFREFFDLMPREMANDLASSMRFIDDVKTGRAGIMHNVPFFNSLESEDLIRIGCRLRPHRASLPVVDEQGNPVGGQIMKQGLRGTEMWLVFEGEVRVERGGPGTEAPREYLGKLRFGEYFGELAVLIEETRGLPVRYTRSAYAATSNCILMVLSHWDMVVLRRESEALDAAVMRAAEQIKAARPSLFANAVAEQGNVGDRLRRLEDHGKRMEEKIDRVLSWIEEGSDAPTTL